MATDNENEAKVARAAQLREQIEAERTKRESGVADQAEAIQGAVLDTEIARLERELAEEKALTARQRGEEKGVVRDAKAEVRAQTATVKAIEKSVAVTEKAAATADADADKNKEG